MHTRIATIPTKKNSNGWIIASQEKAYMQVLKNPLIQTCSNPGGKSYPEEGQPNIPNTYLDRTQNDPHFGRFDP